MAWRNKRILLCFVISDSAARSPVCAFIINTLGVVHLGLDKVMDHLESAMQTQLDAALPPVQLRELVMAE